MSPTESTLQFILPTSRVTPNALLDHLIDILAHPSPKAQAWLDAISAPVSSAARTTEDVVTTIRFGAVAGVAQEVAYKLTLAMARAGGMGWSPYGVQSLVASVYRQVHKDQTNGSEVKTASQLLTPEQAVADAQAPEVAQ